MKQLLYLISFLLLSFSASFAQQVVSTNADDGAGSLRAAITAGNSTSAPYSITFTTAGPISLTAALPEITQSCTIIGQTSLTPSTASGGTTIERRAGAVDFRIFKTVTDGISLTLQDLILQNGRSDNGGAIQAQLGTTGRLTMSHCLVRNNAAIGNGGGGGLQLISGSAIITDCQFTSNSAVAFYGGAIFTGTFSNNNNAASFIRCTFSNNRANYGGGVYLSDGINMFANCTFSNNQVPNRGGAFWLNSNGSVDLIHCSFVENQCLYGNVSAFHPCRIINCLFANNSGSNLDTVVDYITSLGGNVSSDADETYLNQSSDKNSQTLPVGPLQQNPGGLVSTHSIGDCSPAKDAGVTSVTLTLPTTDANNQTRIPPPDAGAYEVQPILLSVGPITVSGPASCASPARLTAPATGQSFVFTGPGGYVFSNTYRNGGSYIAFAEGIKLGGTYTLTVLGSPECPSAPTTSTVVVQGPSSCP